MFIITQLDVSCCKKNVGPCPNGQTPLEGYYCGRSTTRQDCPTTHECIIGPNDAYAVCCSLSKTVAPTNTQPTEEAGSCLT
ncbi:unnamed protein product [Rotaria sp. Silwood2]|nr:unnamed protein product [Rotaria sp. Silwood2]CAF2577626.1 unnamed protein product [Rotaria sp. Silwood2]CAF2824831.1 unnamed protein product [Rotaria sp. Silwood2]CAF2985777.1 unnamed protein product [Rotaria sp. Silwood2]CAF3972674.1 unnamed protein product [Rotaria sp. Silwood2]